MSDQISLVSGDEYIVFYMGGPYDAQIDRRVSTDGGWETEITQLVLQNGKETQVVYAYPEAKLVGDEVHVSYRYDPRDSEPTADDRQNDLEIE
ncbi:oligoribonuclease [Galbitalea sp. SE-J8]|uniref:oligoribonuclease n=1 Tax=Galbitalea sp. SE-J8 TaxID=3054952 RepID=UPI00259C71A3|nr:oligoribonuclease [Galbitalea sp. SE-J8]MDM4764358.1 oligoribonuclease [Galbitalea sp. SE-J8]